MPLTAKNIFEERIPKRIADNPDVASSIGAAYTFHIEGDDGGVWTVDLRKEADWVTGAEIDDAACIIHCESGDFVDMVTGTVPGPQLFMMGKLRVEGDMGLALKLGQVLGVG